MSQRISKKTTSTWLIPIVVIAIAATLIALIVTRGIGGGAVTPAETTGTPASSALGPTAPATVQGPGMPDFEAVEQRDGTDPLSLGDADAPVIMLAFSDYQCPFCALWTEETLPAMLDYVEAGQLRIEWHDIAIFGPDSQRGALAAVAAGKQGAFWEYHEALFPDGTILSAEQLTEERLIELADNIGLDPDRFAADLADPAVVGTVEDNMALGSDLGVYSTPVFVIKGEPIIGAQPTSVFVEALTVALDKVE